MVDDGSFRKRRDEIRFAVNVHIRDTADRELTYSVTEDRFRKLVQYEFRDILSELFQTDSEVTVVTTLQGSFIAYLVIGLMFAPNVVSGAYGYYEQLGRTADLINRLLRDLLASRLLNNDRSRVSVTVVPAPSATPQYSPSPAPNSAPPSPPTMIPADPRTALMVAIFASFVGLGSIVLSAYSASENSDRIDKVESTLSTLNNKLDSLTWVLSMESHAQPPPAPTLEAPHNQRPK
jgi:hypothetical protein